MNEEILLALGRLEGKVDAMMASVRAQEQELKLLEKRIRELENSRALMLGAAAVISTIAGLIVKNIPV
jgi:hypothetical protein